MSKDSPVSLNKEKNKYRALLTQEQQRVAHLSIINRVQRCVLSTPDYVSFLPLVAQVLANSFEFCDIAIYLSDPLPEAKDDESTFDPDASLKLAAWAGDHGLIFAGGKAHDTSANFALRAAREQRVLCRGFAPQTGTDCEPIQDDTQSAALAIPFTQNNIPLGVLKLVSADPQAIDADDVYILQMIATLLATRIGSCLAYAQIRDLGTFQQRLFSSMLHSLLVVDSNGRIHSANERFCQTMGLAESELKGVPLSDILNVEELQQSGILEALTDVIENGVPHELEGVKFFAPGVQLPDAPLIFDIRIFRVFYRNQPQAVLLFINLTSRWRGFHQLQLMSEIGRYFSASLNIDKVLRTVLTCITAGNALGFNRAFLLLADEKEQQLKGTLALGASSAAEAQSIWHELAKNEWSLQQILDATDNISESLSSSQLQKDLRELVVDLDNPLLPALQASLKEHRALRLTRSELLAQDPPENTTEMHRNQWQQAAALFNANELVLSPLFAQDRLVGVVLADNLFSGNLIEDSDVQLLDSLAGQAGLTIDNARTYQKLQKAQKELVNSERLAVVGDMTARLSHEIRNPLATIGGFAHRLTKHPEDIEMVQRNANVIVEETKRLEELLDDLLEMASPGKIELKPQPLSEIVDQALLLANADIKALNVQVDTDYDQSIPEILLDRARLLQALLNIVRNGAQSMPDGGILHVSTVMKRPDTVQIRIRDQGKGISKNAVNHVFDPFYSTKIKGSGLGLPITWRIIQDHDGKIEVESEINEGTTFIISLPLRNPQYQ